MGKRNSCTRMMPTCLALAAGLALYFSPLRTPRRSGAASADHNSSRPRRPSGKCGPPPHGEGQAARPAACANPGNLSGPTRVYTSAVVTMVPASRVRPFVHCNHAGSHPPYISGTVKGWGDPMTAPRKVHRYAVERTGDERSSSSAI